MSLYTTLVGLFKSEPDEPWSREMLNNNVDLIDTHTIGLLFAGVPFANCTKGALILDSDGNPQSQAFTGPNGLVGSVTWTFTATTITETLSITAPIEMIKTITKTVALADLSEEWTVS
jgi:hypothetical protein